MNTNWLFQSSSLDALKLESDERRFFVPLETGKTIMPFDNEGFKKFISNKTVEIKNDRR